MKLLLDACVWGPSCEALRLAGHDVAYAGDWAKDPGDAEILRRAARDGRVLVTLDKDFGTLAVLMNQPHTGIVRLVDIAAREQARECLRTLAYCGAELAAGAIATTEPGRIRVRSPMPPTER